MLGSAVLVVEDILKIAAVEDAAERERAEQRAKERREQLRAERMQWYSTWLADDLDRMVAAWHRARCIRDFLAEYERRLAEPDDLARTVDWRQAAMALAEQIDPLERLAVLPADRKRGNSVRSRGNPFGAA